MRQISTRMAALLWLLLAPAAASAQTSAIAGEVSDMSGAVMPGVYVEVSSPALIERYRSAWTDGAGRYTIGQLRPGTYSVTFTLPGFSTVRRDNIAITSDFIATVNAALRIGAVEETITVTAEPPIVDVQSVTTRTVMTRDVLDAIPTGRNIQAVGIMIPGTSLAVGGGGALSRDVGGSGSLQQSPLQYRGSGDSVQTVEGMRLNNLCASGQYSGVYWNDGSFEEISYVTGAESAEMGQGGIRINMVPKDGGNSFRGSIFGNYTDAAWTADNLRGNLAGDLTYNPNNLLTNVSRVQKIWDVNPSLGGPIVEDRLWFTLTFRHWGVEKSVADSFFDLDPSPFRYAPDPARPGIDDGHIVSRTGRLAWQLGEKDKLASYHDDQRKYRNHWGISANVPPEAAGVQVTPSSFVSVHKWTRTQTDRLLFDVGFAIYNQEYTELYQPEVLNGFGDKVWNPDAIRQSQVYTVLDQSTGKIANAWSAPADHFSTLRTYSASASYVTGSHSFKLGATMSEGPWRLVQMYTGDVQPITYNAGSPVSATLRLPTDRRNAIKSDTALYAQDRWTMGRATLNLGLRYDWFVGETREQDVLAGRFNEAKHFGRCEDGRNDARAGCVGTVQDWKDLSPRVGLAYDLSGDGRTALKASYARYVNGEAIATANANNPITVLGLTDVRPWRDLDDNGSPFDGSGNLQSGELSASTSTATFGRNVSTTSTDPAVLNGWGRRGYNQEITVSAQHQLAARTSLAGGYFRRWFGNQTATDDLRYDNDSYDGPFCITAPGNPNLPGGGGYPVCNLYDLKPGELGRPADSLIHFADDFGGITNRYEGFDVNIENRFANGAFLRGGISAMARTFDDCSLLRMDSPENPTYPDGSSVCHREYPYRPDAKILGSYRLPGDIVFSGTYQYSRGVQTGGAGPSILATWNVSNAIVNPVFGRNLTGANSKAIPLIREGLEYGDENLSQLDLRASKRFGFGRLRVRLDADVYNVTNSNWPFTVNTVFSTAATSAWLRPTNVLQGRMFKLGGQLDF